MGVCRFRGSRQHAQPTHHAPKSHVRQPRSDRAASSLLPSLDRHTAWLSASIATGPRTKRRGLSPTGVRRGLRVVAACRQPALRGMAGSLAGLTCGLAVWTAASGCSPHSAQRSGSRLQPAQRPAQRTALQQVAGGWPRAGGGTSADSAP
ncbi:hypothetical protein TSOC_004139 [Tetrabaena socialis]|uniref:Uncharacterized protein n=1 Tax=Tetrabaena socialis TaxID=47790 RepID=A0A2J8A9R2_9CHLO|nr:hypothetical protein TSOC_004139 [Tetrabaena socialis]|eukprot:PNH09250.1 hypothetical protein TSOC_004139 [Tetrabaena socialis]